MYHFSLFHNEWQRYDMQRLNVLYQTLNEVSCFF